MLVTPGWLLPPRLHDDLGLDRRVFAQRRDPDCGFSPAAIATGYNGSVQARSGAPAPATPG